MNYLKDTRAYLAGVLEFDEGFDWRSEPIRVLREELKVNLFSPHADDKQALAGNLQQALDKENYETAAKIAKTFVRKDLCIVDRSDFIIAYVPHKVPTTGTVHEVVFSDLMKKPTLLVCPQGKQKIAKWYFGIINHNHIFGSWNDLYNYLRKVDRGECMTEDRWQYVYGII